MADQKLAETLNKLIADWTVLYVKLHNFHWFVKGDQFFVLHEKFEELYNEAAGYIDELAERLLALNGKPVATLKGSLEISTLKEAGGQETAEQMVQAVIDDFSLMIQELQKGIELSEQLNDEATGDLLIGIQKNLEKHNWMLKAFLGK